MLSPASTLGPTTDIRIPNPGQAPEKDRPMPKLFRSAFPLDGGPVSPEQILAFHRATFADAQMNGAAGATPPADSGQQPTEAATTPPAAPAATPAPNAPQQPVTGTPGATEAGKVEDLPDWAQKLIKDTRAEAAGHRTKATAAETKQTETLAAIAKALGLGPADEQPDPAKLTEQLGAAQAAQRSALVELAVFKAAGKHSGDPAAILDSRAFLASVADLDPSGSDFAAKIDAAIKAAVDGNPKLKAAAQAAGASTIPHAGGSGEAADIDAQIDAARKAGKHELAISLQRRKAYGAT